MNALSAASMTDPHGKVSECIQFTVDDMSEAFVLNDIMTVGQRYTLSLWLASDSPASVSVADDTFTSNGAWSKYSVAFIAGSTDLSFIFNNVGIYYVYQPQLEIGNVVTDWTPAPEDQTEEMNVRFSIEADRVETQFEVMTESINDLGELIKNKYIKNITENEHGITVSDNDGIYEIQVDNVEGVTIRKNGEIRSQLIDDDFYTGNIHVEVNERARFGNFAFVPRSDGSLSFLKVGD